jgi:hypothetical protein
MSAKKAWMAIGLLLVLGNCTSNLPLGQQDAGVNAEAAIDSSIDDAGPLPPNVAGLGPERSIDEPVISRATRVQNPSMACAESLCLVAWRRSLGAILATRADKNGRLLDKTPILIAPDSHNIDFPEIFVTPGPKDSFFVYFMDRHHVGLVRVSVDTAGNATPLQFQHTLRFNGHSPHAWEGLDRVQVVDGGPSQDGSRRLTYLVAEWHSKARSPYISAVELGAKDSDFTFSAAEKHDGTVHLTRGAKGPVLSWLAVDDSGARRLELRELDSRRSSTVPLGSKGAFPPYGATRLAAIGAADKSLVKVWLERDDKRYQLRALRIDSETLKPIDTEPITIGHGASFHAVSNVVTDGARVFIGNALTRSERSFAGAWLASRGAAALEMVSPPTIRSLSHGIAAITATAPHRLLALYRGSEHEGQLAVLDGLARTAKGGDHLVGGSNRQSNPKIACGASRCLAVWDDDRNLANKVNGAIWGRLVDTRGRPTGPAFEIAAGGGPRYNTASYSDFSVATDGTDFVVLWANTDAPRTQDVSSYCVPGSGSSCFVATRHVDADGHLGKPRTLVSTPDFRWRNPRITFVKDRYTIASERYLGAKTDSLDQKMVFYGELSTTATPLKPLEAVSPGRLVGLAPVGVSTLMVVSTNANHRENYAVLPVALGGKVAPKVAFPNIEGSNWQVRVASNGKAAFVGWQTAARAGQKQRVLSHSLDEKGRPLGPSDDLARV